MTRAVAGLLVVTQGQNNGWCQGQKSRGGRNPNETSKVVGLCLHSPERVPTAQSSRSVCVRKHRVRSHGVAARGLGKRGAGGADLAKLRARGRRIAACRGLR